MPEDFHMPNPWVTFCISTFQRPKLLQEQLQRLLQQTDRDFEIVISDNDPEGSAQATIDHFRDSRIRYFKNETNLGMIPSFNRSVERARTQFVVMVTDDDPIDIHFLKSMKCLIAQFPERSIYAGLERSGKAPGEVEEILNTNLVNEILHPKKTTKLLWSSCILNRAHAIQAGIIPDFGSPHLADHALLVLTGQINGGIVVNKMFSDITLHDNNFSKFNFRYYLSGCREFYQLMTKTGATSQERNANLEACKKYLYKWFIDCFFNLKKYYSINKNPQLLKEVNNCAKEILNLPFMAPIRTKYYVKDCILFLKLKLGLVKAR